MAWLYRTGEVGPRYYGWMDGKGYVLLRFGDKMLRSASIRGQFAALCTDFGLIRCVLLRLGAKLLRYASIWCQIAAVCLDVEPKCCFLH